MSLNVAPMRTVVRQQLSTVTTPNELRGLQLHIPRWLWQQREETALHFLLNDEPVDLAEFPTSQEPLHKEDHVSLEITPAVLRDLETGTGSATQQQVLTLSYELISAESLSLPSSQTIALAVPVNATFTGHGISVTSSLATSSQVRTSNKRWQQESVTAGDDALRFRTSSPEIEFPFECVASSRATPGRTVINELVIHSWLGYEFREDRVMFVWQPENSMSELTIKLPAFAVGQCVLRHNNGAARWLEKDDDGTVTLVAGDFMPDGSQENTRVPLELIYRVPGDNTGKVQLPPPRFSDGVHVVHTFWHVALPADEHLIWAGQQLQNDNSWDWSSGWKRTPESITGQSRSARRSCCFSGTSGDCQSILVQPELACRNRCH